MHFLVELGILFFSQFALGLIAGAIARKPRPTPPDAFQPPTIAAGTPIPIVFGTFRVRPIMVALYKADLVEFNITSNAAFGLPLGDVVQHVGYQYAITGVVVLGWGPATVAGVMNIIFADKYSLADQHWSQSMDLGDGTLYTAPMISGEGFIHDSGIDPPNLEVYTSGRTISNIFLPQLYGGLKGAGGVGGYFNNAIRFYTGTNRRDPDELLESIKGVGGVPSYRDLIYIVYDRFFVGAGSTPPPIDYVYWRVPHIEYAIPGGNASTNARNIHGLTFDWLATDTTGATMIWEMRRHPIYGKGEPAHMLDADSYAGAAQGAASEGFGLSTVYGGNREAADDLIAEIHRHQDSVEWRDPVTFKRKMKLIRNEVPNSGALAALRHLTDADIVDMPDGWIVPEPWETFNVITIEFSNAELHYNKDTRTVRNEANIQMTGEERPTSLSFPMITDAALAIKVGARELRKLSNRLGKGRAIITRTGWDIVPGDVLKISSAKYGISERVVRAMAVDWGDGEQNAITVDLVDDQFQFADILRPTNAAALPAAPPRITRPSIINVTKTLISPFLGRVAITLLDPEHRTYEIAYRTQTGAGAPSAWTALATATPDTADPTFPYNDHVTGTNLQGTYTFDVPLSTSGDGYGEYRVKYVAYGTAADPYVDNPPPISGNVAFAATPQPPASPGVSSDARVRWRLDGGGGHIVPGPFCELTLDRPGSIVGWTGTAAPSATIAFDLWKKAGATPTIADTLGLSSVMKIIASTAGSGSLTPIHFAAGDHVMLVVDSNDVADTARLDVLLQYD